MNNSIDDKPKKVSGGKIFFVIFTIAVVGLGFYISTFAQKSTFDITKPFGENPLTFNGFNLGGLVQEKRIPLKGEIEGRTNILILGEDYGGITDTIIVLSYYHSEKKLATLSLPRDLRVDDGFGRYKINAMYELARQRQAAEIDDVNPEVFVTNFMSRELGIPLHYWAKINIEGASKIIDEVGGLDIEVENSFSDCEYPTNNYQNVYYPEIRQTLPYIYPCPKFVAGPTKMDSKTALIFARSRKSFDNPAEAIDFARSKRQSKVIEATINKLKLQATSGQILLDLPKINRYFEIVGQNFKTNLDANEAVSFFRLIKETPPDPKIMTYALDFQSGALCQDPAGTSDIVLCGGLAFGQSSYSAAQGKVQNIAKDLLTQASNRQNNDISIGIIGNGSDQSEKVQQALVKSGFDSNRILFDNGFAGITQATIGSVEKATFFITDQTIRERIIKASSSFDFQFEIIDKTQDKYKLQGNFGSSQIIILVETVK